MTPGSPSLNSSAVQSSSSTTAMQLVAAEFVQLLRETMTGLVRACFQLNLCLNFVFRISKIGGSAAQRRKKRLNKDPRYCTTLNLIGDGFAKCCLI